MANENVVQLRGDCDNFEFVGNRVNMAVLDTDAVIECATGKDITGCLIAENLIHRLNTAGDLLVDNNTTANSGIAYNNRILHADVAGEILIDADGVGLFDNKGTAVVTASGYVLPAIDS